MRDMPLNQLIMAQLGPLMAADPDLAGVQLVRNFQPLPAGATTGPTVYFVKITDKRYGSSKRKDVWNIPDEQFDHAEIQTYETSYQFSAWIPQDVADPDRLTESDILNIVSGIMQSDTILQAFRAAGVGVIRVTEVRNPYEVDDRNRFEAVPSFDIVFTHTRERVTTLPAVVTYDARISRV